MDLNGFQLTHSDPLRDAGEAVALLARELDAYAPTLLRTRPMLIAANKVDQPGAAEALPRLQAAVEALCESQAWPTTPLVFPISAARGDGLAELALALRTANETAAEAVRAALADADGDAENANANRRQRSRRRGTDPEDAAALQLRRRSLEEHLLSHDADTVRFFREQASHAHDRVW